MFGAHEPFEPPFERSSALSESQGYEPSASRLRVKPGYPTPLLGLDSQEVILFCDSSWLSRLE